MNRAVAAAFGLAALLAACGPSDPSTPSATGPGAARGSVSGAVTFPPPPVPSAGSSTGGAVTTTGGTAAGPGPATTGGAIGAGTSGGGSRGSTGSTGSTSGSGSAPVVNPPVTPALSARPSGQSEDEQIAFAYSRYLYVLAGLDDHLNSSWLPPLAEVATDRLAKSTARQAYAISQSRSHGVGSLRNAHVIVKHTGPASASLADCEDYVHFYLVSTTGAKPDPAIVRGFFVGTAQLVKRNGQWVVDVFSTTRVTCAAF